MLFLCLLPYWHYYHLKLAWRKENEMQKTFGKGVKTAFCFEDSDQKTAEKIRKLHSFVRKLPDFTEKLMVFSRKISSFLVVVTPVSKNKKNAVSENQAVIFLEELKNVTKRYSCQMWRMLRLMSTIILLYIINIIYYI